jgi:ATP-dependent DNA helicase RecG
MLLRLINEALDTVLIPETIPDEITKQYSLLSLTQSFTYLHRLTKQDLEQKHHLDALTRLKTDELVAQQLILYTSYQEKHSYLATGLRIKHTYTAQLIKNLTFRLTKAQERVLNEIYTDLAKPTQMNRLLQGDVGSGKTIVATLAMLVAVENGYQACIMAPTEILAKQHYLKISELVAPLGIKVVWLVSSLSAKERKSALEAIASNSAQIIIGTHAVFQEEVLFSNLALVVVDEQHRFGVHQRLTLQNKGKNPHQLMMSATPIPRTLAMAYYADLDLSIIDELPPNRTPIKTLLINNQRRGEVLSFVRKEVDKGAQVYWVCPLIEESEALNLENALNVYAELSHSLAPVKVGLVHGKLKSEEKASTMHAFSQGEIQVLVATTVIEVGVDVPNASIMIIEHSERMGLAQLHQLRGRVGRGQAVSQCILLYQLPLGEIAKRRLKVMQENTDGFIIAKEDLLIRGPGEILGARQSGLPELRFADITEDANLIAIAKDIAKQMTHKYSQHAQAHMQLWLNKHEQFLKA